MKIQESSLQLQATHESNRVQKVEVSLEREFQRVYANLAAQDVQEGEEAEAARKRVQQLLQSLIDAILAALGGKKCAKPATADGECALPELSADSTPAKGGRPTGLEIHWRKIETEYVHETEQSQVCGSGQVRCADGRVLDFDFSFAREREFEKYSIRGEEGTVRLRDPLILSFPGCASELSDQRIDFDLDEDGEAERIPGLNQGCGFLVFDRNGNGRADHGGELFGVKSGNGFADLKALDADGNGWVDEGDADFSRLRLWTVDGVKTLAEAGIGALSTAQVAAPFALKDADNGLLGQIRAAGIYLSESGQAGQMVQVDLAVEEASGTLPATADGEPGQRQQRAA